MCISVHVVHHIYHPKFTLSVHAREGYCSWVSVCVHLTCSAASVLKILSHTQRSTEVNIFVRFSLKPLHCRDPALPQLKAVGHFLAESQHCIRVLTRGSGYFFLWGVPCTWSMSCMSCHWLSLQARSGMNSRCQSRVLHFISVMNSVVNASVKINFLYRRPKYFGWMCIHVSRTLCSEAHYKERLSFRKGKVNIVA